MKEISLDVKGNLTEQHTTSILDNYGTALQKADNELLYTPERPENAAFYITDGYVRLVNRELKTSKVIGPGEFFGDRSIFHSKKIHAESLSSVRYLRIDEPAFSRLMHQETKLAMDIVTSLSKNSIFLHDKPGLISRTKEIANHIRKGHTIRFWLPNRKRNKECVACCG